MGRSSRTHQNIRNHSVGYMTAQDAHGVFKALEKKEKHTVSKQHKKVISKARIRRGTEIDY